MRALFQGLVAEDFGILGGQLGNRSRLLFVRTFVVSVWN
jgi:hypothetical protein